MIILIDSDLLILMERNSYLKYFVNCEIDKMNDKQENYVPVNQHFNSLGLSVLTMLDDKAFRTAYIRLVI